jgi:hypothetical protein
MKIGIGRKITISFREAGADGRATLVIDVATDAGDLPHEHRDDLKAMASELLGVPLDTLKDVEVKLKKTGPPHSHDHDHPHPHPEEQAPAATPEDERRKQEG